MTVGISPERWREIERLYQLVQERAPGEREAFLRDACAGDEDLRKEVAALLADQSRIDRFIESPAMNVAAKALAQDQAQATLKAGQMVAHYRVVEEIGQGGMGVVYRAEDSKLKRTVALKCLPPAFAGDPERLARFEREARLLASLNHPNIAAIYGLEEAGGRRFLVLELVEGETLAQKIIRGPLPVDETFKVCRQIAEGLEYAHERGIIHRDLKPANVKLTAEGQVKVLDFGLAKAQEPSAGSAEDSPTLTVSPTRSGTILGTAAYMSPEQASGKLVDRRADIWSFGAVLFELLTGHRLFEAETASHTLADVLRGPIDFDQLPRETPAAIRHLLRRCLDRDVKSRLRDIGEARVAIESTLAGETPPSEALTVPRRFSLVWLAACGVVMILAGILIRPLLTKYFQPTPPSASVITSTIKAEPGHWLAGQRAELERPSRTAMAISGDGRFVVYSAIEENPGPQAKPQLYLRRMDQAEAEPITGTEGGINPFLSPDNRWVGFWADGKLKKISVEGGVATELCDARNIFGADWGADNRIVFADEGSGGLSLISSEGGKPEPLTKPDPKREESSHRLPSWLRNGKAVFFSVMKHSFDTHPSLSLFRLDTHEWQALLPDAANARYVSTGHLVFLRQGVLMAVRFDEARLEIIGQPIPLVPDVMQVFSSINPLNTGAGQFALSGAGSLIYAAGGIMSDPQNTLVWVDQKGNEQPVTDKKFPYFAPRLSPDGEKIAYATLGREYQIHVYDISKGTNILLTNEGWACFPVWTPDSKKLIFAWRLSLATNLFWRPYDGSSEMERLTTSEYNQYPESYPPGGTTVTLAETSNRGSHIDVLDTRTGRVTPFLNSPFNEQYPEFSPDRRWIAYVSNESGRNEVFVQDFPDKKIKIPVSSEGGTEPLWARNGKQIFFRCEDQVWAADVQTEGRLAIGKPRLLFEKTGYEGGSTIRAYDLSLDDQRFLMTRIEQRKPTPITEMILVQNWFEELKQKVPTGSK